MALKRWDEDAFVDLTILKRWDGASWVDLTVAKRWDGTSWINLGGFAGSFGATISPGTASGLIVSDLLNVTVTSNSVTATPVGGTGPYTYAWTWLSGDSAVAANSPTSASTTFSAIVPKWDSREATMRVTVTDSLSATATADIFVMLRHDGTGTPP